MFENIIRNYLGSIITMLGFIITGIFWVHTMDGIPKRVDKLEIDVGVLKTQMSKNDTKTDIILEDTKYIKQFILQEHARGK